MKLDIPDDILTSSRLTAEDCLIEISICCYADRRISLAQAPRFARLDCLVFECQLARRDISLYTVDDLRADVEPLQELGRL